jgi:isocitrate/isopropylmalate dehydrogenase
MKSYDIALIPGDGTGPEVVAEGVKVLNAACAKHGIKLNYQSFDLGGERNLRCRAVDGVHRLLHSAARTLRAGSKPRAITMRGRVAAGSTR